MSIQAQDHDHGDPPPHAVDSGEEDRSQIEAIEDDALLVRETQSQRNGLFISAVKQVLTCVCAWLEIENDGL